MKTLIVCLCFFTAVVSAQEESPFEIKDNLFNVSLFHNISLSNKLTLQNGLSIRRNPEFVTLEVPVLIKYAHSDRWSSFLGAQARTVVYSYFPENYNIEKPSSAFLSIGTEYEFNNNTTGNLTVGFPFDLQVGLKF
ncbi:hypothetical protein [Bizionia arctica]|uniref:DUF3575 domain-containing protein n=1 Tax=Bizionia arctica TaxID=1495645 RepID=A0A917LMH0_9FLAO|nr:hypothetical protein [Bizionia arctica]GGG44314.1 hypothetical protein GCM10010976_14880 [Bizionia arctica]